ncbi:hypothetical protein CCACVL1_20573 [Corchorus capsularis]|uniref:Uncharacterized protein n=1 Tax=Corchorus capsularis TaxID=210143 RepID=A0A1R3HAI6_COCAP|nr:hypothetical protein CCACVL1_20573 [Corchorus capsularis]
MADDIVPSTDDLLKVLAAADTTRHEISVYKLLYHQRFFKM